MITYDLIGNTPLVLLEHYSDDKVKIYRKLEQWNPGGSVKDRLEIFSRRQFKKGVCVQVKLLLKRLHSNTGIGLAIAANRHHLKCKILRRMVFRRKD